MVMITLTTGQTFYMDKKLKQNLDILLDACKDDDDLFLVFDGQEGSGKSKFMQMVGAYAADYLGTKFGIENIQFKLKEYIDFSLESPHYTVNVLDEGRKILNRKAANSKVTRKFTDFSSECRELREIHLIGVPAYHDLDKYLIKWRMKGLIHIIKEFKEDPTKKSGFALSRGTFKLYTDIDALSKCYDFPYSYPRQYESYGKFPKVDIISDDEYKSKKGINMKEKYHSKYEEIKENKFQKLWKSRWCKLAIGMKLNRGIKNGEIADLSDMETKTVSNTLALSQSTNTPINQ